MLIAEKQLRRCSIEGVDGTVGTVKDLMFDGRTWQVRYLDVDTGRWLPGRRVILSPEVIGTRDYATQRLATRLTREQVKGSPSIDTQLPVSRQKELELARYYAWGVTWTGTDLPAEQIAADGDPDLRSAQAVSAYRLQATDGEIGHIDDFIVDDQDLEGRPWEIRYLVVDTRNWLPGEYVLVPPLWAESIDWDTRHVRVGLTREMVKSSPPYDPATPINRQYETVFYDYYGRPKYWRQPQRASAETTANKE